MVEHALPHHPPPPAGDGGCAAELAVLLDAWLTPAGPADLEHLVEHGGARWVAGHLPALAERARGGAGIRVLLYQCWGISRFL